MAGNQWERLEEETDPQWYGFQQFLVLGRPRKLTNLVDAGFNYSTIKGWSSVNRWYARAAALDEIESRGITEAMVSAKLRVRIRQIHILENAADLVDKTFERLKKEAYSGVGPGARIHPRDAAPLLRTLITLQQLVMGEATERVETKGPGLEKVSDDDLDEMIKIYDKANGRGVN